MKRFISALLCLMALQSFSQDSIPYFPQEQIILKGLESNENASSFFYEFVAQKLQFFLGQDKVKKQLAKYKKDSLKVSGTLTFDNSFKVDTEKSSFRLGNKSLNAKFQAQIEKKIFDLPVTNIIHRKPEPYISRHVLTYQYLLDKSANDISISLIKSLKPYTGGTIQEGPRFPGCEDLDEKTAKTCFKLQMQEHLKLNFRYPEEAEKKGISGKVYVIFNISKEGLVKNIRTRGPNPILEEEAVRIIKLLPKMKPGKENGRPVIVPFSIPIGFKLR